MQLKVWHIPQIPGKPFEVEVQTLSEAVLVERVLADYDLFQYENRIKPDYANAGGIAYLDADGEWCDADIEDADERAYLIIELGATP